jgi:predicted CoA-binding protein
MDDDPAALLRDARTIAVVGASPEPFRSSHGVMRYLLEQGYRCIPVNPNCDEVLGVPTVGSLAEIDEPIDLVDVFRQPQFCPAHAREAVAAGAGALWLQVGIVSREARAIAAEAGLAYVENACTAVVHATRVRGGV